MTALISLNALGGSIANLSALQAKMSAIDGGALVMDSSALAQSLKAANPASVIVHRSYNPNDANWWNVVSPYAWVQTHAPIGANGVILQCHNEPVVDAGNVASFVGWNVSLLIAAHAARLAVAVGGFSVGNPHESLIDSGAFDPLLKGMNAVDCLLTHEYFLNEPTAPGEYGYLCGRVEHWLKRMQAVGCKSKTVVIGEYGRDLGGGLNDGWRGQGWSVEHYAELLIDGMRNIYHPLSEQYGVKIVCMVYCAGTGFGQRWQSFNVEGEAAIYSALESWNKRETTPVTTYPPGVNPQPKVVNNPHGVNLRAIPDAQGQLLLQMSQGQRVTVYEQPVIRADDYDWQRVTVNGLPGWSAMVISGIPSFVDPAGGVVTVADLDLLIADNLEIIQRSTALDRRLQTLRKEVTPPVSGGGF